MTRPQKLLSILLVSFLALAALASSSAATAAAYPVNINPLVFYEQKVTAADGATDDGFGVAVAIDGDTAVIGANAADVSGKADQGAAYVFVRSGSTWSLQQKLVADDGLAEDYFGGAVTVSGDTVLIGASGADNGSKVDQGAAYVFVRSGATWAQQARLLATGGAAGDDFGVAVALSGDTALVGADLDDVGPNTDKGSAYIFTRSSGTWIQRTTLSASDGHAGDQFGYSVALSGGTALVGVPYDDYDNGVYLEIDDGSAYVFTGSGATWTQQAKLIASDVAEDERFGWSVALSGETALVGSVQDVISPHWYQGSAYVYVRSAGTWSQQQKLVAADGETGDNFGNAVALSLDTALVGAPNADISGAIDQGAAYIFTRSGATWTQQDKLTASDGAAGDWFGIGVALSGSTPLVGASGDNLNQGAAYFYGSADIRSQLTVIKHVVNDDGGTATAGNFTMTVTGNTPDPASFPGAESPGTTVRLNAGSYSVGETGPSGYYASYSADCSGTIGTGESRTCTVTNNDGAAHLKLVKVVDNGNGGTALITAWTLSAAGPTPLSGAGGAESDVSSGTYSLSESAGPSGYTANNWSCTKNGGAPVTGSSITLAKNDNAICTITNDDIAPKLHLRKVIVNDNGGTATAANFTLTANGTGANDLSGTSPVDSGATLKADTWALSETTLAGYTASAWNCTGGTQNGSSITVGLAGEATCTITNTFISSDKPYKVFIPTIRR